MTQKTLGDLVEIMLAKKMAWNVDTTLKIVVGGTELGALAVTGKIEYVPTTETERKTVE
jgi:hypothetical protein